NAQCETCLSIGTKLTPFFPKSGSVGCTAGGCQISYHDTGDGETSSTQPTGANCTDGRPTNDCSGLGGNYVWNPYFNVCEPMVPECPDGQVVKQGVCVREDFCPAGQVMNEQHVCVPHEGDCPAGTSRDIQGLCNGDETQNDCPAGTVKGADGTCKPDSDADG